MSRFVHNLFNLVFIDQDKKQISHSKFWANVGYAIMCAAFVHQVWDSTASTELYLTFGAIVIGNRTLNKWLTNKTPTPEKEQ